MSQTQETVDRAGCCDNAGRASGTVGVHSKVLPIHFGEKTQALLSLKGLVWPELWAGHTSVCVCCVTIITWKIHQHQQMIAQDTWWRSQHVGRQWIHYRAQSMTQDFTVTSHAWFDAGVYMSFIYLVRSCRFICSYIYIYIFFSQLFLLISDSQCVLIKRHWGQNRIFVITLDYRETCYENTTEPALQA